MEKSRLVKPFMVLIFVSVAVTCCFIQPAASQSSTIMKVETPSTSVTVGIPFTITITLTNVQNLYGVEVVLKWNPTILQATNIDTQLGVESYPNGVLHETSSSPPIFTAENNVTQNTGEYRLVATSMAPAPSFSGSGSIVKITFNPINEGNSAIDLESQLSDYPPIDRDPRISLPIQHITQDSFVTVIKESSTQSPNPTSSPTPTAASTPTLEPTTTPTQTVSPSSSPASTETPKQTKEDPDIITILLLALIYQGQ
jgi:cell division septation protein DedD